MLLLLWNGIYDRNLLIMEKGEEVIIIWESECNNNNDIQLQKEYNGGQGYMKCKFERDVYS